MLIAVKGTWYVIMRPAAVAEKQAGSSMKIVVMDLMLLLSPLNHYHPLKAGGLQKRTYSGTTT